MYMGLTANCVWGKGLEPALGQPRPRPSGTHHVTPLLNVLGSVENRLSFVNATFVAEKFPSALLFNLLKTLLISSLNLFMANVPHLFFCQSCPSA